MKTAIPWALLALATLYRFTWGRPDPDGLRRRLNLAHRETREWRAEAIQWKQLAVLLDGPSFKETE